MAKLKTQPNDASIENFLDTIEDAQKREDSFRILEMMRTLTGDRGKMWGSSIVGFGHYHYKYASGREGDWFQVGFSPRKQAITLYIMDGFGNYESHLAKIGKYKTGKSCLYIKRLSDIDEQVLRQLIADSLAYFKAKETK